MKKKGKQNDAKQKQNLKNQLVVEIPMRFGDFEIAKHCHRQGQGDSSRSYTINCVLLNLQDKSFNGNLISLYFTDFSSSDDIGPQKLAGEELKVGNQRLERSQIFTAQIRLPSYKQLCEKQLSPALQFDKDSSCLKNQQSYDEYLENSYTSNKGTFFQYHKSLTLFYFGLFCKLTITNVKSYNGTLEADIYNIEVLLPNLNKEITEKMIKQKYGKSMIKVMKSFINSAGSHYVLNNKSYLTNVVPKTLFSPGLQRKLKLVGNEDLNNEKNEANERTSDNKSPVKKKRKIFQKSIKEPIKEEKKKDKEEEEEDSNLEDVTELPDDYEEELEITKEQLESLPEELPFGIETMNTEMSKLPENSLYHIKCKVVDFNNGEDTLVVKDELWDIPRVKNLEIMVTDKLQNFEDLKNFIITKRNCLTIMLDTVEEILEFFGIEEIEDLYVNQKKLLIETREKLMTQFSALKFATMVEMNVYKKRREVAGDKNLFYVWGVKGLKLNDL